MKILILVSNYLPIMDSAARLYSQLAEDLSDMGHDVIVITEHPAPDSPVDKSHEYYSKQKQQDNERKLTIYRLSSLSFLLKIPGGKALRFFISFISYFFRSCFISQPDVMLVYSPPIFMGVSAYLVGWFKGTRFVVNMQDIHPKVLIESGVIKNRFLIYVLSQMEKICVNNASSFIVYSQGNKDYLERRGVVNPIHIIPNWVDTAAYKLFDKETRFHNEDFLRDKFVLTYAGTMQPDQGLEIIIESADLLRQYSNIVFIIAGEGLSKIRLQEMASEKKIQNVLFRTVMPKNKYIQFLFDSDVCLITLSPLIPHETVPGKLSDIMASGKPLIASVNKNGDAAQIIKQANCGISVAPGDITAFTNAVLELYENPEIRIQMGDRAKKFAENNFSRNDCTKRFEQVLIITKSEN